MIDESYVPVAVRIQRFYETFPDGRIAATPPAVIELEGRTFLSVTASVYRSPDDPCPCVGSALEPFPGKTSFTRDSEAMNAETSAIGRALAAAGVEVHRSMASREEVQARQDGPGIPVAEAKGRVLAGAQGDQVAARRAWSLTIPAGLTTVSIELVEAAENVARSLVDPPADDDRHTGSVSGIAAARAALEEVTGD